MGLQDDRDLLPESFVPEMNKLVGGLKVRLSKVKDTSMYKLHKNDPCASATYGVFAVLVVHNLLLDQAKEFVASTPAEPHSDPPAALVRVWRAAHRLKGWLRPKFMELRAAAEKAAKEEAKKKEEEEAKKKKEEGRRATGSGRASSNEVRRRKVPSKPAAAPTTPAATTTTTTPAAAPASNGTGNATGVRRRGTRGGLSDSQKAVRAERVAKERAERAAGGGDEKSADASTGDAEAKGAEESKGDAPATAAVTTAGATAGAPASTDAAAAAGAGDKKASKPKKVLTPEEKRKRARKKLTHEIYSNLSKAIIEKCKLLLRVRPVPANIPAAPALLRRSSSSMSQDGKERSEAQKKATATLAAWRSANKDADADLAAATTQQRYGIVWRLVLSLLDTGVKVLDVRYAVLQRRRRAKSRAAGFLVLRSLLQSTTLRSAQREVMVQLSASLCANVREANAGVAPSFSKGIQPCGPVLQTELRSSFASL